MPISWYLLRTSGGRPQEESSKGFSELPTSGSKMLLLRDPERAAES